MTLKITEIKAEIIRRLQTIDNVDAFCGYFNMFAETTSGLLAVLQSNADQCGIKPSKQVSDRSLFLMLGVRAGATADEQREQLLVDARRVLFNELSTPLNKLAIEFESTEEAVFSHTDTFSYLTVTLPLRVKYLQLTP